MKPTRISWPGGRRIWAIARLTVKTALRQRLVAAFLLLALVLGIGALGLRSLNFGRSEAAFLADCGFGVMAVIGSVLAIALTAQLVLAELENRTVYPLFAKPVTRAEFVLGKFLGLTVLLATFCALIAALLALVLGTLPSSAVSPQEVGRGPVVFTDLASGAYRQWLKLSVLVALVLLVASYARTQLFVVMAGLVLLLAGHLQPAAHAAYSSSPSALVRAGGLLTTGWLPDFTLFGMPAAGGVTPVSAGFLSVYAAGYVLIGCGLAVFCFSRREL